MNALEAATEKLERAMARLEAAEAANTHRLDLMRVQQDSAAADLTGGDKDGLVKALKAAQTENDELVAFNEDIVSRLDGTIRRLKMVLADDGADRNSAQ